MLFAASTRTSTSGRGQPRSGASGWQRRYTLSTPVLDCAEQYAGDVGVCAVKVSGSGSYSTIHGLSRLIGTRTKGSVTGYELPTGHDVIWTVAVLERWPWSSATVYVNVSVSSKEEPFV